MGKAEIKKPFMGMIKCSKCGHAVTGEVKKVKHRVYVYYHCANQACEARRRNIPEDLLWRQYKRLPSEAAKEDILSVIKAASAIISLKACLDLIGLSGARYHAWIKRQVKCELEDQPSCPRVSPTRLTVGEIQTIKELYTDRKYFHFSTLSLSLWAKKSGKVLASASSWSRVIREAGLKRSRVRVYPARPKIGIRASAPFQILHIDVTILRLTDGSRAFIQCVIDNFSRYALAHTVSRDYGGKRTKELLIQAIAKGKELGLTVTPNVLCDSGCENAGRLHKNYTVSRCNSRFIQ